MRRMAQRAGRVGNPAPVETEHFRAGNAADQVEIMRSFWLVTHGDLKKLPRIAAVAQWLQDRIETLKA